MLDAPPPWAVTAQREDYVLGPDGAAVPGWVITFRTAAGQVGSVRVPLASYRTDTVRDAINAAVATIEAVASLTGATPKAG